MKITAVTLSCTVLVTVIAAITFVSDISDIHASLETMVDPYLAWIIFGMITAMSISVLLATIFCILKSFDFLIHKNWSRPLCVKLSSESKMHLGGYLIFEVRHTSWLFAGYFAVHLQSPYLEEKQILVQYDDATKLGRLKGKYTDKAILL